MRSPLPFAWFLLLIGILGCTHMERIRESGQALQQKQYAVAIPLLQKEIGKARSKREKSRLMYQLAEAFEKTNAIEQACRQYLAAYEAGYDVEALQRHAALLKFQEQYDESLAAYKLLSQETGSVYSYQKEESLIRIAKNWKKEYATLPLLEAVGLSLNSRWNEFDLKPYGGRFVFSTDRPRQQETSKYPWTGNAFFHFMAADAGGNPAAGEEIPWNQGGNNATIAFNADQTLCVFTRCGDGSLSEADSYCQLYSCERSGSRWSAPRKLKFQKDRVNYTQPCLSADGSILIFSSNDADGPGGYDLYVCERKDNNWSNPLPLPRSINTVNNEHFPFLRGDTLFFASDQAGGMGGLDVYASMTGKKGSWGPARNLKPPVNSGADDFSYIPGPFVLGQDSFAAFFASNRPGGAGNDDLYGVRKRQVVGIQTIEATTYPTHYLLRLHILENTYATPQDPNSKVIGQKDLEGASVTARNAGFVQNWTSEPGQEILFPVQPEQSYEIAAGKEGYLSKAEIFSMQGIPVRSTDSLRIFDLEIILDKIFLNREIVLKNIYYDFDQFNIRSDARPVLNELARVLQRNPGIRIELSAHTDCRGDDRYNETLSQKRAQSVVDYLISQGIDAARVVAKGYGESLPTVNCPCQSCTEEEHQKNRRTSFRILSVQGE